MSKNSPNHKNFLELKAVVNGAIVDKIRVPYSEFKKVTFKTKLKGTDRLFLVGQEYAQVLEKYL